MIINEISINEQPGGPGWEDWTFRAVTDNRRCQDQGPRPHHAASFCGCPCISTPLPRSRLPLFPLSCSTSVPFPSICSRSLSPSPFPSLCLSSSLPPLPHLFSSSSAPPPLLSRVYCSRKASTDSSMRVFGTCVRYYGGSVSNPNATVRRRGGLENNNNKKENSPEIDRSDQNIDFLHITSRPCKQPPLND